MRERFDGKQASLAAHVGIVANLISRYLNGTKGIGEEMRDKIEDACALPRGWLDTPKDRSDEPLLPSPNSTGERQAPYSPPTTGGAMKSNVIRIRDSGDRAEAGYVRLEHLSVQPRMGMGATVTEPVHLVRHLDVLEGWLRDEVGSIDARRVKVLTAVGRSMLPTIKDRDLVFVDVAHRHFDAPGIYVLDVAGRLLLKKVMIKADGTLVIRSDNTAEFPDEETYRLDEAANDVTLCGKVLAWWTLRKG